MKHFIDPATQEIFAYAADGSEDGFIKPGLTPISDEELAAMRTPPLEKNKNDAQVRIDSHYEFLYKGSVANAAIGAEYDAAYMVAKEWLKDTAKPAPERIKALAESYGVTNVQAAGVVVLKWTEAQAVAFDLRGAARLRAKLAIRQAEDREGVAAAELAGRAAMEAVVYSV